MKAFSSALTLALLAGTAACGQAGQADGNNGVAATASGGAAPIANDSETANSTTGKPAGGDAADPAAVEGPSEGAGPGDKPAGDDAPSTASTPPAGGEAPAGDKPQ